MTQRATKQHTLFRWPAPGIDQPVLISQY